MVLPDKALPFALPELGQAEIDEVVETLRSGWLTTGARAKAFEAAFARYLGVPQALAVNSGTAGLHLALEAAGVDAGSEVITTTYTFTATAEVVRYLGADPVFVDIEPDHMTIDPGKVEAAVTGKTKAIVPVHFGGQACEMDRIMEIAGKYGLKVIEDAAHALPCTYKGRYVGTIGHATVFSFYVTKPLATGEGGMVVTADEDLARRIGVMRLHGIDRDVWDRYRSDTPSWYYEVVAPGFKYNMTDIAAAIGVHQVGNLDRFQQRRQEIAARYNEAFQDLPVRLPAVRDPADTHAWHLYVIRLALEETRLGRDAFIEKMSKKGIGTSVHFIPLHLHPYWRERYGCRPDDFPVALDSYRRAVSLPIYSRMTDDDIQRVIAAVRDILS